MIAWTAPDLDDDERDALRQILGAPYPTESLAELMDAGGKWNDVIRRRKS